MADSVNQLAVTARSTKKLPMRDCALSKYHACAHRPAYESISVAPYLWLFGIVEQGVLVVVEPANYCDDEE